jgi:lysophospholipase L1-like esterase
MRIVLKENQFSNVVKLIMEVDSSKLNVLFVGDSLSSGPGWTWNYLLSNSHPNWNVTHLTEGGKRTSWMLDKLISELKNKKYDLVFIYGGTNDMFSLININEAVSNIQKMVNLVKNQGGKAYVFKGYDAESVLNPNKLKPTKYCDKKCMLRSRQRMIDFKKDLSSISNATIIPVVVGDSTWTSDGIHPGSSKHEIMKNHVEGFLGKTPMSSKESKNQFSGELSKENVKLIHGLLQLLGYSEPEWGVSETISPEFITAVKNFKFDQGLEPTEEFGDKELSLLKDKLGREGIDSSDLNKIELLKTKTIDSSMEGSKFEKFAVEKHGNKFLDEIKKMGDRLGLDYKVILATMYFESKMSPSAQNPSSNATGLIQFMPFTAKSLGTTTDSLKSMSAIEQLKYVEEFYKKHKNLIPKIKSPEEAYLLVFYPAAVGKPDDYVLGNTSQRQKVIAKQNKPFDMDNNQQITKGEIMNYVRKKWGI